MPTLTDFPARGRVKSFENARIVFLPSNTNYQLHLQCTSYDGPIDEPVQGIIRVQARKVYTVPSGGNFIQPIFGPPRIVQGRVRHAEERLFVVRAGTNFVVELPLEDTAIDLNDGSIALGRMINVVTQPGARFELLKTAAV